ncbi:MAG TPA: proline dehydrogenase transcriptional activator, partial [Roseovarius nubinhibens]|nr:proline dehydrogenase transcriptional activator [Roseovarius nubinhibens]
MGSSQNDQIELDRFDHAILRALSADGRMSIT